MLLNTINYYLLDAGLVKDLRTFYGIENGSLCAKIAQKMYLCTDQNTWKMGSMEECIGDNVNQWHL